MDADSQETLSPDGEARAGVKRDVDTTLDHLRTGRATRGDAIDLKNAAERCLVNHDLGRAVGRL